MKAKAAPKGCTQTSVSRGAIGVWLLLCAPVVFGQHKLRSLSGIVTDPRHEPLKGAVIEVHNDSTNSVSSYITDRTGRYSFKRLDGDTEYSIWATYQSHRSRKKTLDEFDTNRNKVINLVIKLE